jgi:hypothetical protein
MPDILPVHKKSTGAISYQADSSASDILIIYCVCLKYELHLIIQLMNYPSKFFRIPGAISKLYVPSEPKSHCHPFHLVQILLLFSLLRHLLLLPLLLLQLFLLPLLLLPTPILPLLRLLFPPLLPLLSLRLKTQLEVLVTDSAFA